LTQLEVGVLSTLRITNRKY